MMILDYERTYNPSFSTSIAQKMQGEIKFFKEECGFNRDVIKRIRNYYLLNSNTTKVGDVSRNIKLILFVLDSIGFANSKEERLKFVQVNLEALLDSYSNFGIKLAILSYFDFLKETINENYLSRLRLPVRYLYALLSSNIKFASLLELEEIYEKMFLEDRKLLLGSYPLTSDIQKELFSKMINKMNRRNELRRKLIDRRIIKKTSEK